MVAKGVGAASSVAAGAAAVVAAGAAGAVVAAGAGAVVAAGAAGAEVAVGSSPPQATIIVTKIPNNHSGLKIRRLNLRNDCILYRPHINKIIRLTEAELRGF